MEVFVVIKRQALDLAGGSLETLGVFRKKEDARKAMLDDFKKQEYEKDDCEEYKVSEDSIYIVGGLGFSYDHYWAEVVKKDLA